ncbi:hypothetical protein IFM47457_07005 [Aspergillus lentulus]|nr:hypothetical protein IFM47457_07005 [Aspergillus lentulus]
MKVLILIVSFFTPYRPGRIIFILIDGISTTELILNCFSVQTVQLSISGFGPNLMRSALACGRRVVELAVHGEYQTLDMSEIRYERIAENRPPTERAMI